jgi:tRNA pseudouridine55 synthase
MNDSAKKTRRRPRAKKRGRDVNGMLLLDKPAGVSSNGALQSAKSLLEARKGGHTGSLDPIATGLLPLCFGETTKISGFFLDADKRYWTRIKLGESTETGDREGAVIFSSNDEIGVEHLMRTLDDFRGEFEQTPPMYSAIKKDGQPLYKLARQGIEIERESRPVTVYALEVTAFDGRFVELEIRCSRGFYVRSLAHDLGAALGVGGHVSELRRLGVGSLDVENAVTLTELEGLSEPERRSELLLSSDAGLTHLPRVDLSVDATFYLVRGQSVRAGRLPSDGWVRLYSTDAGFLGLGAVTEDGRVAPKRLFHKTLSVSARNGEARGARGY